MKKYFASVAGSTAFILLSSLPALAHPGHFHSGILAPGSTEASHIHLSEVAGEIGGVFGADGLIALTALAILAVACGLVTLLRKRTRLAAPDKV